MNFKISFEDLVVFSEVSLWTTWNFLRQAAGRKLWIHQNIEPHLKPQLKYRNVSHAFSRNSAKLESKKGVLKKWV